MLLLLRSYNFQGLLEILVYHRPIAFGLGTSKIKEVHTRYFFEPAMYFQTIIKITLTQQTQIILSMCL